ncbi:hypothetical protein ALC57_05126, partial [Trachymyrmex cornetzi]
EYRILIKHCFLMGKTSEQSLQWLQKCYPTSAPSRTTVYRWFSEFKMAHTSTEDAPHSGRPKEATNEEIVKQVHRIVLSDRKVKLRELVEAMEIIQGTLVKKKVKIRRREVDWWNRSCTRKKREMQRVYKKWRSGKVGREVYMEERRKFKELKEKRQKERREEEEAELRCLKREADIWKVINKKRDKKIWRENNIEKEEWRKKHFMSLLGGVDGYR